jgi:hypothetical protein
MTLPILLTLLASVMALLLSIGALLVALRLLLLSRSTSSAGLSVRLGEVESTQEALTARLKGLNSRVSMFLLRERRRESTEPTDEAPPRDLEAEQKATRDRLNSLLAQQRKP